MMKQVATLLLALLWVPALKASAQDKPPEKPQEKARGDEHPKPASSAKVQVLLTEYDGEKKIASMPYTFTVVLDERVGGYYSTNLRTGVRVPVLTNSKDQSWTYIDVGANVDCGVRTEQDGRYHLYLIFDRSALYPEAESAKLPQSKNPDGSFQGSQPLIRQFRTAVNLILRDGQSLESVASTDPLNGHVFHINVTLNVQK